MEKEISKGKRKNTDQRRRNITNKTKTTLKINLLVVQEKKTQLNKMDAQRHIDLEFEG